VKSHRLNAIGERLVYWRRRTDEAQAAYRRAAEKGDAMVQWEELEFCWGVYDRLRRMLEEAEVDRPHPDNPLLELVAIIIAVLLVVMVWGWMR
jgi:hypothetical protein